MWIQLFNLTLKRKSNRNGFKIDNDCIQQWNQIEKTLENLVKNADFAASVRTTYPKKHSRIA